MRRDRRLVVTHPEHTLQAREQLTSGVRLIRPCWDDHAQSAVLESRDGETLVRVERSGKEGRAQHTHLLQLTHPAFLVSSG